MPVTGDFEALSGFYQRLNKLSGGVAREIAQVVAPKIEPLVDSTIANAETPYGEAWVPTKDGRRALAGSTSGGRVFVRLVGKSDIRVSVLYPFHFHHEGTRTVGRKALAKIRAGIVGKATRLAVADIIVPRKRKGEGEFEYQQRIAKTMARRNARRDAVKSVKNQVSFAQQEARSGSRVWDPERPIIPAESRGIPTTWEQTVRENTREVMAQYDARPKD